MKRTVLIYKSKTGFTKKYADWIAETVDCQVIPDDQMSIVDIQNYDCIIYGAGIRAGSIQGLKRFKKLTSNILDKKLIVYATGGAPFSEEIYSAIVKTNFAYNEKNKYKCFYFQSGLNYGKMNIFERTVLRTYSKFLGMKKGKSEIEMETNEALSTSYDQSNKEYITPMIDYLKS